MRAILEFFGFKRAKEPASLWVEQQSGETWSATLKNCNGAIISATHITDCKTGLGALEAAMKWAERPRVEVDRCFVMEQVEVKVPVETLPAALQGLTMEDTDRLLELGNEGITALLNPPAREPAIATPKATKRGRWGYSVRSNKIDPAQPDKPGEFIASSNPAQFRSKEEAEAAIDRLAKMAIGRADA